MELFAIGVPHHLSYNLVAAWYQFGWFHRTWNNITNSFISLPPGLLSGRNSIYATGRCPLIPFPSSSLILTHPQPISKYPQAHPLTRLLAHLPHTRIGLRIARIACESSATKHHEWLHPVSGHTPVAKILKSIPSLARQAQGRRKATRIPIYPANRLENYFSCQDL